jgi:phosphatidyl-myo-inositol alpha-mannosyltransferase
MKIAQICPYDFSRPGGVKSHILSLSSQLSKLGHEVKIIAPNINKDLVAESNIVFFGKNRSLNFGGTKIDINIALGDEWRELRAFIRKEKFDVIHFHTIWNPLLPFQVRLLSLKGTKHIATFHDTPKSLWVGKTIMPLMARLIFPFIDQIISVSESQSKFINRFSSRDISIIPNGIDLDQFKGSITEKRYKNTLLFLGRLEPRKGVFYAIKAFEKLKTKNPDLKLIIAGDGDQRVEIESYISANQIQDITLLGFVSEIEKIKLLQQSSIYLATAIYGESFGIVLLEAMAAGIPMAGFANEGYKNIITPEISPYFKEPKDIIGLCEAAQSLFSNDSQRDNIALNGISQARDYDWKFIANDIENLYNQLIKNQT